MNCFCGASVDYQHCCQPLHLGLRSANTPQQLMRSRYSAYAVGAYDYVLATYHPTKVAAQPASTLAEIRQFGQQTCFLSLEILQEAGADSALAKLPLWTTLPAVAATSGIAALGYVHFQARLLEGDRLGILDEISRFVQEDGQWFYLDGLLQPYQSNKVGRNDTCPCGSGKKFKVCTEHHRAGR